MSNKVIKQGWSFVWLLLAAAVVIPMAFASLSPYFSTFLLVIGIGLVLFVAFRIAKAVFKGKYLR